MLITALLDIHIVQPPPPPPHPPASFFLKGKGWTFSKLVKRGGGSIFFFNKGRDRKKWLDGVITARGRGWDKENLQNFFIFFKGNPNFQGILNWILQTLHYYCRKQHKNIKNSQINEQNVVMSLCPSLFTATCAPFTFLSGRVFSVLGHSTPQNYIEF